MTKPTITRKDAEFLLKIFKSVFVTKIEFEKKTSGLEEKMDSLEKTTH